LAVGQAAYAPDGTGFVVGRLTEITDAASASNDAFRENLSNVVARGMAEDLIEQLGAALRVRHSVSTYPGAIEQVYFGQSGHGGMAN
jgi:hypothetical protein